MWAERTSSFGVFLFLALGVVVGVPLTVNLFGGSMLTDAQYQTWKVVHGYAVFLATINGYFGLAIDRLDLSRRQKELASWSHPGRRVVRRRGQEHSGTLWGIGQVRSRGLPWGGGTHYPGHRPLPGRRSEASEQAPAGARREGATQAPIRRAFPGIRAFCGATVDRERGTTRDRAPDYPLSGPIL